MNEEKICTSKVEGNGVMLSQPEPLPEKELAAIRTVSREPRFLEIYLEEKARFPHQNNEQLLLRVTRIWYQPAL